MQPLLHVVRSNRLLIAAFSDHGEIVQVFHQARVALDGEHHPGPLTRSIGHIPPSEGSRLGGSFREHVHLITHPFCLVEKGRHQRRNRQFGDGRKRRTRASICRRFIFDAFAKYHVGSTSLGEGINGEGF